MAEGSPADEWFTVERRVGWPDTDPSGAWQFTAALRYVEEAEISLLRSRGVLDALYPHLPRVAVRSDYRQPAFFDDAVRVRVRIEALGVSSVTVGFRIDSIDGAELASGAITSVYVGGDGTPAPLPEGARSALAPAASPDRESEVSM